MPYTLAKRRRASRSCSTPLVPQTTETFGSRRRIRVDLRRVLRLGSDHDHVVAVGRSWPIAVTAATSTTALPCAVRSVSPVALMAAA